MWGRVSCPGKQHHGRDWASNHQPSDLKSNAQTTVSAVLSAELHLKQRQCEALCVATYLVVNSVIVPALHFSSYFFDFSFCFCQSQI